MSSVAIVGGGPGGLIAANLIDTYCGGLCSATLFESASRVGGKILTKSFNTVPIMYEAGVAELYDYTPSGHDPLRNLVKKLGLKTVPMAGGAVILGDQILRDDRDIARQLGAKTLAAINSFYDECASILKPSSFYEAHWTEENTHPWMKRTFREVLDTIPDEMARRYVEVAARSDLATEPHQTTALDGLKNILMDNADYLRTYSIQKGLERLVERLRAEIKANVILDCALARVGRAPDGRYRMTFRRDGRFEEQFFDFVVLALPTYWLARIDWEDRELRLALQKHLAHYDAPAHYLRISVLFDQPFWRKSVPGSFFMSDAFGGCCIYDEGSRHPCGRYGVLGWLLAGNDAMALGNLDDQFLVDLALDSLPKPLAHGRALALEGRVQRWTGTLNALPGGRQFHDLRTRHQPAPISHPGLFLVGDYLFDSTINGVYDSADFATDLLLTELRKQKYAYQFAVAEGTSSQPKDSEPSAPIGAEYFDLYDGGSRYEESFQEYFCADYTIALIQTVWGRSPPYKLLDCGSANGLSLEEFARRGVEAWGIENNPYIHARTKDHWNSRNLMGDVRKLPFPDNSFDFVYETCLCHIPEHDLDRAIREIFRVCGVGVFFSSVTSDMTEAVIEKHYLFEGVQSLFPLWEWADRFGKIGFRPAITSVRTLSKAWKIETECRGAECCDQGDHPWYPDRDRMRFCFFSKQVRPASQRESGSFRFAYGARERDSGHLGVRSAWVQNRNRIIRVKGRRDGAKGQRRFEREV